MSSLRWSLRRSTAVWFCLALGVAATCLADGSQVAWHSDFAAAQAEAEREQRPLLVHFSATWCQPCSKMNREVLKSADVKRLLDDRFIGVKVDADKHPELVKQFGIQMLPSDLVIDPHNGRVLAESQGATDLKAFLTFAGRAEHKFGDAKKVGLLAKQDKTEKIHEQKLTLEKDAPGAASTKNPLAIDLGNPQPLVGLDGFSPVALFKGRKWTRGSAEFTYDYQGVTYQMSSSQELAEFRKDPQTYAPRLLGCDPVVLWESDRVLPGRTQYGAFYDDELYLFTSAENRKRFKANPRKFIKTQHVLKIDQIDRTALLDESHLN